VFGFFKREKKGPAADHTAQEVPEEAVDGWTAPGTRIHYDAELIYQLRVDHRDLVELYTEIVQIFETGAYVRIGDRLHHFRTAVQEHFMKEKISLYIYLEHSLPRDSEEFARVHAFRQELEGIGKAVLQFLRKYENIAHDQELIDSFQQEFAGIGEVLTKRITAEETELYPLYHSKAPQ